MAKFAWKTFIGGVLLGSVGFKLLRAPEADRVYEDITAAVLVGRDALLKESEKLTARSQDIYEVARIKADRYQEKQQKKAELKAPVFRGTDE